jgi:hypothetical protein
MCELVIGLVSNVKLALSVTVLGVLRLQKEETTSRNETLLLIFRMPFADSQEGAALQLWDGRRG